MCVKKVLVLREARQDFFLVVHSVGGFLLSGWKYSDTKLDENTSHFYNGIELKFSGNGTEIANRPTISVVK